MSDTKGGKMPKSILERPLAFTDVETTGVEHIRFYQTAEDQDALGIHFSYVTRCMPWVEIIEIGLVLVDHNALTVQQLMDFKVKPEHPERHEAGLERKDQRHWAHVPAHPEMEAHREHGRLSKGGLMEYDHCRAHQAMAVKTENRDHQAIRGRPAPQRFFQVFPV